ncbi:GDSL-like Lipase/Acylhydrolase [Zalerion maritima]|uniref:GDSL-like Lipase/Acylhydrolase n=1 Tax=Zalerion maritima TaxID=339359 RepID=A0AAD5WMG2_9PEZI|nr:GDSL-like Lipase/Acylhydrolase [Zalerion maritima]
MPLRTVRILCFGDSLTCGYTQDGTMYHPYAHNMMKILRMAFPEVKLDISVEGEAGDYVCPPQGYFYQRLKAKWDEALKRDETYDWVLLLGGTNDLGDRNVTVEEIFTNLEKMHDFCFARGAKVMAMTIPECGAQISWLNERRNAVNDMIRNCPKDKYYVFDLHTEMPYHKLSQYRRKVIWDDGLHFTTMGYSLLGGKVADYFLPLLRNHINTMPRDPPSPISPSVLAVRRRSRAKSDAADDKNFEEEQGDPKVLSQGYIIVRKRDLD